MERKKTAELEVKAVHYTSESGLLLALPSQEARVDALKTCNDEGRFSLNYPHNHEGHPRDTTYVGDITRIFFQGTRRITPEERGDHSPMVFKEDIAVEIASYSFQQWKEEGKPLRVRLDITEKFFPLERV